MKKVIASFLALCFASSALFNTFVVADYFARYNYYDTVLCVNKATPTLKCHGTCHLKAELTKAPDSKKLPALQTFACKVDLPNEPFLCPKQIVYQNIKISFPHLDFAIANPWQRTCFHPPEMANLVS